MRPADVLSLFEIYHIIVGAGEIKNEGQPNFCLDADQINATIDLTFCHGHGLGQYWMLTKEGQVFTFQWNYRKVASSRLFQLVVHPRIFRLFINGKFDACVL